MQTAPSTLPAQPAGESKAESTTIHSHPIAVSEHNGQYFPHAVTPSDQDRLPFSNYGTNIIVGNLTQPQVRNENGQIKISKPTTGAAIRRMNAQNPSVVLTKKTMEKISQ